MKYIRMFFITAAVFTLVSPAHALTIDFIYDPADPVLSNPDARAAAEAAAMSWINRIDDDVTVKIELKAVNFGSKDANGRTSFGYIPQTLNGIQPSYELMRNAMINDENAESDVNTIVSKLPTWSQFISDTPNKLTAWNVLEEIWSTSANLKALGFSSFYPPSHIDATIEFNMHRNWDFDRNDLVTPPQYDFQTMLVHEIGHVLGFQSAIDQFGDWWLIDRGEFWSDTEGQPFPPQYANVAPTTLDMFRFGSASLPTIFSDSEFTNTERNLNPFVDAAYLILTDNWSDASWEANETATGQFMGDGRQASHWKNRPSGSEIGVMDAVMPAGLGPEIMESDLRAMDVIGWDLVAKSSGGGVTWNGGDAPQSSPSPPINLRIIDY